MWNDLVHWCGTLRSYNLFSATHLFMIVCMPVGHQEGLIKNEFNLTNYQEWIACCQMSSELRRAYTPYHTLHQTPWVKNIFQEFLRKHFEQEQFKWIWSCCWLPLGLSSAPLVLFELSSWFVSSWAPLWSMTSRKNTVITRWSWSVDLTRMSPRVWTRWWVHQGSDRVKRCSGWLCLLELWAFSSK